MSTPIKVKVVLVVIVVFVFAHKKFGPKILDPKYILGPKILGQNFWIQKMLGTK